MTDPAGQKTSEAGRSGSDDRVLPFRTVNSGAQGRLVRLGAAADEIIARHGYPDPVSQILGEALALTALLGSLLQANGRLILQTQTDGPLRQIAINYTSPGQMRGLASFDAGRIAAMTRDGHTGAAHLIGSGHMAMTIDRGGNQPRTQGIVALNNHTLAQAAYTYFRQSEQIPTFVRLVVARHQVRASAQASPVWRWRAGGLIVQQLPDDASGAAAQRGADPRTAVTETEDDAARAAYEEDWNRARMLASTVEDHELLDPTLEPERLLYRLFADEGVRVLDAVPIRAHCGCTRERVERLLKTFGAAELSDMREEDGGISVTCEYCSTVQRFSADEVSKL
jgi:molecular chaperone Hsp33